MEHATNPSDQIPKVSRSYKFHSDKDWLCRCFFVTPTKGLIIKTLPIVMTKCKEYSIEYCQSRITLIWFCICYYFSQVPKWCFQSCWMNQARTYGNLQEYGDL